MGLIEVRGIRVHAYHGCLEEEARIGGTYRVDIAVSGEFSRAEQDDRLEDTVDYGRITALVLAEMAVRSRLIEQVAARILSALKREWKSPYRWRVCVVKEHPPVPGQVEAVAYILEG